MKRLCIFAALVAFLASPVAAQTPIATPAAIPYDNLEIEPEAGKGPVQCVIWVRDETRREDPHGIAQTARVEGVVIFNDSDYGWIVAGHAKREATGDWNLKVGDDCTGALLAEK